VADLVPSGMPRATLKIRSNEALVALSDAHPDARFDVLGAWPTDERLRVLVETSAVEATTLQETLAALDTVTDIEIRHSDDRGVLFEATTPSPEPHGAMAESGVVPSFPLRLEGGWFVGDLTASRSQLSAFRDELEAAGIEYRLVRVSDTAPQPELLTDRQEEVVELALDLGYYDTPREATHEDVAAAIGCAPNTATEHLQKGEAKLVRAGMTGLQSSL
jgi:predicted DNA binding protein